MSSGEYQRIGVDANIEKKLVKFNYTFYITSCNLLPIDNKLGIHIFSFLVLVLVLTF